MKRPLDYWGPPHMVVPDGYTDVTTGGDAERHGVPSSDHHYYTTRNKIAEVLTASGFVPSNKVTQLAEDILEVL